MPRVYVHIGLPKTATTTLQQDVFPYIDKKHYDYLGVIQPRSEKSDLLYESICRAINTGECIHQVSQDLSNRINQGKSLILSEEMFVVSNPTTTWQTKLQRLAEILANTEYRILLTVREPVSAMFSFYVELYNVYSLTGQNWQQLALNHNDFRIYHYSELFSVLRSCFANDRLYVQSFEQIIKGDLGTLIEFLEQPEFEKCFSGIGHQNRKASSPNSVIIQQKRSLYWLKKIYQRLGGINNPLLRQTKKIVNLTRKLSHKNIEIAKPTPAQQQHIHMILQESLNLLQQQFGINYTNE